MLSIELPAAVGAHQAEVHQVEVHQVGAHAHPAVHPEAEAQASGHHLVVQQAAVFTRLQIAMVASDLQ